jgi:hypothetical protein
MRNNKYRALIATIILVMTGLISDAQFSGGVVAGVNFSDLTGSSVKNNDGLTGYSAGILGNYSTKDLITGKFGEIFSIQAELRLDQIGTTMSFPSDSLATDTLLITDSTLIDRKFSFSYVRVPVLFKFNFGRPNGLNYFAEVGVYGAGMFGLTVDGEKKRDHDKKSWTDPRNYRDEFEGYDMGAVFGAGLSVPLGSNEGAWRILGDVRYYLGLANIVSSNIISSTSKAPYHFEQYMEEIKTRSLSVSLGFIYRFPPKK